MLQDKKVTCLSCCEVPQPFEARKSLSDHQSSVVVTKTKQLGDLVLRGGRLNSALIAASDGGRRVDGRLGISGKVTASRRLILRVGTSICLDSRVLDVVGVGSGRHRSKRSTGAHAPVLVLNRHTATNMLADGFGKTCRQTDLVVMYVSNSLLEA